MRVRVRVRVRGRVADLQAEDVHLRQAVSRALAVGTRKRKQCLVAVVADPDADPDAVLQSSKRQVEVSSRGAHLRVLLRVVQAEEAARAADVEVQRPARRRGGQAAGAGRVATVPCGAPRAVPQCTR